MRWQSGNCQKKRRKWTERKDNSRRTNKGPIVCGKKDLTLWRRLWFKKNKIWWSDSFDNSDIFNNFYLYLKTCTVKKEELRIYVNISYNHKDFYRKIQSISIGKNSSCFHIFVSSIGLTNVWNSLQTIDWLNKFQDKSILSTTLSEFTLHIFTETAASFHCRWWDLDFLWLFCLFNELFFNFSLRLWLRRFWSRFSFHFLCFIFLFVSRFLRFLFLRSWLLSWLRLNFLLLIFFLRSCFFNRFFFFLRNFILFLRDFIFWFWNFINFLLNKFLFFLSDGWVNLHGNFFILSVDRRSYLTLWWFTLIFLSELHLLWLIILWFFFWLIFLLELRSFISCVIFSVSSFAFELFFR